MYTSIGKSVLRPIACDQLAPERWRNGKGVTRTVASHTTAGQLRWRISIAEVVEDCSFSIFPGFRRAAILMRGPGLSLHSRELQHRFEQVGAAWHFDGEEAFHARLGGGPARLWNVIVARDEFDVDVRVGRGPSGRVPSGNVRAVLALDGEFMLSAAGICTRMCAHDVFALGEDVQGALSVIVEAGQAHWAIATINKR